MTKPAHQIRRHIAVATLAIAAVGVVLSMDGCQQRGGGSSSPAVTEKLTELNRLQEKRMTYEKQLKGMSVTQLATEMSSDSEKGREQFNSAAYREAVSRGKQAASEVKAQLKRATAVLCSDCWRSDNWIRNNIVLWFLHFEWVS